VLETNKDGFTEGQTGQMRDVIRATKDFAGLPSRLLKFRTPLYHPSFPFVILWSQKAACTTVVKWFFLQLGLLDEALSYHPWIHQYEGNVFKRRPGYLDDVHSALSRNIPVVKFVRDPYARAYSSYLSVCHAQAIGTDRHWVVAARQRIFHDLVGDESALEYAFSFRQFLEWLAEQRAHTVNPHIRLQYAPRDQYLNIRFCKVESLTDNFRALEQEFGLPHLAADHPEILESAHFHKKKEFDRQTARALLDLGVPVQRSEDFPYVKFNRELAEGTEYTGLIRKCFQLDLELYDYLGPLGDEEDETTMHRARRAGGRAARHLVHMAGGRTEDFL
jgi:hypothetical protein